ncbi:hypothetical protein MTO96_001248 [Rhipicephalus appendiculatus]
MGEMFVRDQCDTTGRRLHDAHNAGGRHGPLLRLLNLKRGGVWLEFRTPAPAAAARRAAMPPEWTPTCD